VGCEHVLVGEYEAPSSLPPVVRAMLGTTHDRHEDLAALVTGLPDDALAWTPCADAPALAGLVLHILDVEGHLAAIAAGEDDHWAGENGSHILDSATGAALRDAIFDLEARMRAMFASIDNARLEASAPGGGQTLGQALLEDLDHCAIHHGQAQLTRNLWEAAHPDAPRTYEHWR
jgi:Protein of unknown function (DUF664)